MPTPVDHRAYVVDNSAQRESIVDLKTTTTTRKKSSRAVGVTRAKSATNKSTCLARQNNVQRRLGEHAAEIDHLNFAQRPITSISSMSNSRHRSSTNARITSVRSAGNRDARWFVIQTSGAHPDCVQHNRQRIRCHTKRKLCLNRR